MRIIYTADPLPDNVIPLRRTNLTLSEAHLDQESSLDAQ